MHLLSVFLRYCHSASPVSEVPGHHICQTVPIYGSEALSSSGFRCPFRQQSRLQSGGWAQGLLIFSHHLGLMANASLGLNERDVCDEATTANQTTTFRCRTVSANEMKDATPQNNPYNHRHAYDSVSRPLFATSLIYSYWLKGDRLHWPRTDATVDNCGQSQSSYQRNAVILPRGHTSLM